MFCTFFRLHRQQRVLQEMVDSCMHTIVCEKTVYRRQCWSCEVVSGRSIYLKYCAWEDGQFIVIFFQDVKGFSMLLFHSLGHGDSGRWLTVTGLSLFFFYIHIQSIQSNRISLQYYFLYVMYMYIIKVIQYMPLNPYFLGVKLQLRQITYTENWSVRHVWSNLYMYVAVNFRSIDKPQY